MSRNELTKFTLAGMFAAMAFVCFSYLRLEIPMGLGLTGKIYVGYTFIILAALMLGPKYGGLTGAVGLTLADVLAGYLTSAPPTFVAKFILGWAVGFIAHKIYHLPEETDAHKISRIIITASVLGSLLNVATEPVLRYSFKYFILGLPHQLAYVSAINCAVSMAINNVVSTCLACFLYKALPSSVVQKAA